MKQKRIALINDITGFGRCSTTIERPLMAALKVQVCPLPTAILSSHTGFDGYYMDDYSDRMQSYIDNWSKLQLEFDGILTGFLSSEQQIHIVNDFIKTFKRNGTTAADKTLLIVDPVMGDDGQLYASYTPQLCRRMKVLLPAADVLTPNLTEACNLIDRPYPVDGWISDTDLCQISEKLADFNKVPSKMTVIITGIERGVNIGNYIYQNGQGRLLQVPKTGAAHSGTGDAFVAIVAASMVKGETATIAVNKAAEFVRKSLIYTEKIGIPGKEGICFEEYLTELR
ncbi:pyridoxamine kinase [Pectinatus frisingensis]|uniref:pyridoxamine kinase n=1 Tax=Pectinatus frisingensis TaxID=865 RepID=UPI0018C71236|nr:pyridoxamine kinase [Pectinatus frisingensis]